MMNNKSLLKGKILLSAVILSTLSACGSTKNQESKNIIVDGSSTVFPITNLIVEKFNASNKENIEAESNFSGSIGGFRKFCQGETDINNSSVPIPQTFMTQCKKNGVAYIELPVAFDALTVVTNPANDWAKTITVEELKTMWQPSAENKITRWNQVNNQWADKPLNLFGADRDSGTFEYFTVAIIGEENSRNDYVFSEDDNTLVQGVIQDPNALGYFGYAYYSKHKDKLQPVAVDSGSGGILPSDETIKNNSYRPLTRPLFIYVNAKKAQENKALAKFVTFYLDNASQIVHKVGYLPLPDSAYKVALIHFNKNQVGTVFNGKPELNATINELLNRTYAAEGKEGYVF
ncbi:phosphate ABC transporter [Geminocystis sp. NIES-3708]|uniref:PstS family phosphate ABC transporter substrate-binding protein n=1 Tax=Geminocystis sp. NIES-3708 TaxID=1615909 RepID=UPI0005FCCFBD|nr:PstS family phosphate ABC transporter substrate-binding protein [Geminocystis sp. NIES-3708]BAQ61344.1 phosphate ABC transporter [Geminocystis sp. NIES-3708]